MADESTNKTISSTDSGFPAYLDFGTLRSEAIAYLGNLTGKIWTDYNAHDPGITILETLIYAVLDLGYRTNLPIEDILTRAPDDSGSDNNFFTASQILANNPLTITDYRKLLVDINGVKNAWLEVDDNTSVNFCKPNNQQPGNNITGAGFNSVNLNTDPCRCDFLNGLYHVFIELEKDYDLTNPADKNDYDAIIENIKCTLMSHRNLCEDFVDIKVLCKLKIGLCADIELQTDVNPQDVYLQILETLRTYFSPQPRFYTLPQLLDKGKPIDEIFAGRPYNVKESYGFVDTDEFEAITLRKKLHLSDVYHVLFDIDGVKTVRNLSWKLCNNSQQQPQINNQWELQLPENFIPELDVTCSGFQFFKNGIKISVDTSKANALFSKNFSNGKILYEQPSPNLDTEIPPGVYRSDLADYRSIQNDFPHVYGIREGDLPLNATDERKAQALQLQGFLLFFDQLLANYLAQLKNIRSLFALSPAENKHTYFINQLTDVPQLDKLLRFSNASDSEETSGATGSVLVFPTGRKNLESLIASGKIINTDLDRRCNDVNKDDFPPYKFCYATDCEEAENQLRDDFLYGNFNPVVIANYNNCYFFYCFTSSNDFALISKKYYRSAQEAQTAAASIIYLATFPENYRSFLTEENGVEYFSFDLELNLSSYANYLQLICENTSLYNMRRQDFLNHLLARFAESFTDFALLNADLSGADLQTANISAEEAFLTHYDDISSNRGKSFNYQCDIGNDENISGFEKRFKALCGIETFEGKNQTENLCNFVVEQADEIYQLSISLFGNAFTVEDKKVTYEAGYSSLSSLYKKLANNPTFSVEYLPAQQQWHLFIKDDFGNKYSDGQMFASEKDADAYGLSLQSALAGEKSPGSKVFVSEYVFQILLKNNANETVEESIQKFKTKEDATIYFNEILPGSNNVLHDTSQFSYLKSDSLPGNLLLVNNESGVATFIDKGSFEFKPVDFIQLENVKKKFALLDNKKTFQFDSLVVYDDETLAEKGFEQLLTLLTSRENYFTKSDTQENKIKIVVKSSFSEVATYFQSFESDEEANAKITEIFSAITTETYSLRISDPVPESWEFKYELSNPGGAGVEFYTNTNFKSENEARAAADQFYNNTSHLQINKVKNDLQLSLNGDKTIVGHAELPAGQSKENADAAKKLLEYHRLFLNAINEPATHILSVLSQGKDPGAAQFVYKLVDKNHFFAKSNLVSQDLNTALTQKNNLIASAQAGYDYTTIFFGNEAVHQRTDPVTNTTWFHFVLKCTNIFYQTGDSKGQPLVMFESVQGYASADDAQNAFSNNYLPVLRKAHDDANYGPNKAISLTEIFNYNTSACNSISSNVFVPSETLYEYGGNQANLIAALITFTKSYPVLYIEEGRYRFTLFNKNTGLYDWRSVSWFATPQEAMQQFLFFLSLLGYAGNYYIEKDDTDCHFRIYIREVLAISTSQFATAEDAWGANGVEKFICVAQSENGFHNYLNRINCSNSFFVACGNTGLVHPCKYETADRRDVVMNTLFKAGSFNFFDHIQVDKKGNISLSDLENNPVASIMLRTGNETLQDNCEKLISFVNAVYDDKNYVQNGNAIYLTDENKNTIATPVSGNLSWTDWKKQLQAIACYFPVFQLSNNKAATNQQQCIFYVQIKLPGFNNCADDLTCGCPDVPRENDCKPGCYLAWKSDCCFGSCCDALHFYLRSVILLQNFSNYKAVYQCDCGNFGIELHADVLPVLRDRAYMATIPPVFSTLCAPNQNSNNDFGRLEAARFLNTCDNQIIAINPQNYGNASEACLAVKRARELINEQGLHLVEHILLRPRCKNADGIYEDCNCEYLPKPCMPVENPDKPGTICHFKWIPTESDDPCVAGNTTCFTPGCDPYSFIATIALPAWPERFRSPENQALIEKMLQTEAPAHVLLRILWLKPRDLCCFEYYFKKWHHWLAKKMCDPQYSNCDFLGLLFHKSFETLDQCNQCVPCSCNDTVPVSCFDDKQEPCADFNLTNQLNSLYCWNSNDYESYPCENTEDTKVAAPVLAAVAGKPIVQSKNDTIKTAAKAENMQPAPTNTHLPVMDDRKKNLILQARFYKYKENIKKIAEAKHGNKPAENALRFLSDTHPGAKRYDDLINKILNNKPEKSGNIKALTLKEKNILIDNVSWQYFDRVCLNEKKTDEITTHDALFNHLRKNRIDMKLLYGGWNSNELKTIEPGINFKKIKTALT